MTPQMTDAQIARLFELCGKVAAIRSTMPAPPPGMNGDLELAKNLRSSLEKQNDVLIELGAMLK